VYQTTAGTPYISNSLKDAEFVREKYYQQLKMFSRDQGICLRCGEVRVEASERLCLDFVIIRHSFVDRNFCGFRAFLLCPRYCPRMVHETFVIYESLFLQFLIMVDSCESLCLRYF